ncbi:hypothetical protein BGW36DRAFT_405732 [Talaromyces proteolyticus]|uniref:Zn(2)-C6 fungal-type domain-containing protein n=1 Tax=Talaromyces proteolyticus TaxID=1131652 RepID=A0AAD4KYP1_9EURO|nr:uncharacterized protein BGW36DRAFT_405732 [Talaromyces proteolyticus]KAH8700496.1 hypothetical protein BGW36DRAFT_405732 [Talaromyces proteolyticus]
MATTIKRKDRVSRITTACNPCRSRKQKCSGERPTCEQCIEYRRECAWPEQLKRGPAKGYTEALENRLLETENVLLTILSNLSQPQLYSILSENISRRDSKNQGKRAIHIPSPSSHKRGVDYWKSFPLSSAEDIRRWEKDCHCVRRSSVVSEHDADTIASTRSLRRKTAETTRDDVESAFEASPTTITSHENINPDITLDAMYGQTVHRQHHPATGDSQDRATSDQFISQPTRISPHDDYSPSPRLDQPKDQVNTSQERQQLSTWEAAPSIDFQRQFLW